MLRNRLTANALARTAGRMVGIRTVEGEYSETAHLPEGEGSSQLHMAVTSTPSPAYSPLA